VQTEKRPPKILVLVLAVDRDPWQNIEVHGQARTWRSQVPTNVQVIRYIGSSPFGLNAQFCEFLWKASAKLDPLYGMKRLRFIRRIWNRFPNAFLRNVGSSSAVLTYSPDHQLEVLKVDVPDVYSLIGLKTLQAFRYALEHKEFDYIYRTNVSSYVDLGDLLRETRNLPLSDVYAGAEGFFYNIAFASGSGYLVSRDVVAQVVTHSRDWNHLLVDDVALGEIIEEFLSTKLRDLPRRDFTNAEQVTGNLEDFFHFRCKALDPNETIQIMERIHTDKNLHERF